MRLTVQDEGPDVPAQVRPRLGTRCVRADPARTRASGGSGGSGLGLAITERVVRLHGGTVWFESPAGAGMGVAIDLPAEESTTC